MSLALVIGASRGLGLELVRQYRAEGWDVIATARDAKGLERLRTLGAEALQLDVTAAEADRSSSSTRWSRRSLDGRNSERRHLWAAQRRRSSRRRMPTSSR